ncbi:MAG: Isochorismate pyruvate lyase [Hyphomicrobiaceae bacterium hypho_1]
MAKKTPVECQNMSDVRVEIDRLDSELVELIGERFLYVERAWQIKLLENSEANVPWRNQQVVDRVRQKADKVGVPSDLCEALWRQMIGWFIQYEEEKLQKSE